MTAETPNLPERRRDDSLVKFRLDKMEREQEKTNDTLMGLDAKLDTLRADLFERSIFVNLSTMQLELQTRDFHIKELQIDLKNLQEQKDNDTNLRWVKVAVGVSLLVGLLSSALTFVGILTRT